ncbi:hypothetical protein COBT_003100, partial [Conglomerata obtusa]
MYLEPHLYLEVIFIIGMVMGFKNAPQILQRVIDQGKTVSIYMEDIIVCGKTRNEQDKLLLQVLTKLIQNNLKVYDNKSQLELGVVELLGVKING